MARVRVRLVSLLRDAVGKPIVEVEVEDGATLGRVVEELFKAYPKLGEIVRALERRGLEVVYMVNGRFSGFDERVREGDEVVLLPPASGG
jgi:MoaD family protein